MPVARHAIVSRDGGEDPDLQEYEDYIVVDGLRISKPFVEKPVDAEDHNVWIYYPRSMGGGTKRLFRKIKNKSSQFFPDENEIRREGSYIYEEFLVTGGTDIKVYVVGPDYAHAEGRKSPALDGVVMRDVDGKEVRYPILLNTEEKTIARRVCLAFRQNVCGFDLLRTTKGSFVCDVNGWSFVKKSHKYYDDAANLLTEMMLSAVAPEAARERQQRVEARRKRKPLQLLEKVTPSRAEVASTKEELRCVIAIIRHGDRTPKQKLKMKVKWHEVIELHRKYSIGPRNEAKLKTAVQLQDVLETTRKLLARFKADPEATGLTAGERADALNGLEQIRTVLEAGGRFSGINRKVQLKPVAWEDLPAAFGAGAASPKASPLSPRRRRESEGPTRPSKVMNTRGRSDAGPNDFGWGAAPRDRSSFDDHPVVERVTAVQLILKWGGVLTHAGHEQAGYLGQHFRMTMYPGESVGLIRLHSTFRHDLKIYASDEGRVQMTAAAFARGFLELDGELPPILASLVRASGNSELLDNSEASSAELRRAKATLKKALAEPLDRVLEAAAKAEEDDGAEAASAAARDDTPSPSTLEDAPMRSSLKVASSGMGTRASSFGSLTWPGDGDGSGEHAHFAPTAQRNWLVDELAPTRTISSMRSLTYIGYNPRRALQRIAALITKLTSKLEHQLHSDTKQVEDSQACGTETRWLANERWRKLEREFYNRKKDKFDLSKIPDIYDCIKYDMIHNAGFKLRCAVPLFKIARAMADLVIPLEYGIGNEQKRSIAAGICYQLTRKLVTDVRAITDDGITARDKVREKPRPGLWIGTALAPPPGAEERHSPSSVPPGSSGFGRTVRRTHSTPAIVRPPRGLREAEVGERSLDDGEVAHVLSHHQHSVSASPPQTRVEMVAEVDDEDDSDEEDVEETDEEASDADSGATRQGDLLIGGEAAAKEDAEAVEEAAKRDEAGKSSPSHGRRRSTSKPHESSDVSGGAGGADATPARTSRRGRRRGSHAVEPDQVHQLDHATMRSDDRYGETIKTPARHVRTRLYFTSESHIHSIVNIMRLFRTSRGSSLLPEAAQRVLSEITEFDYMTHLVIRMYENTRLPRSDPNRFRLEILFSPGSEGDIIARHAELVTATSPIPADGCEAAPDDARPGGGAGDDAGGASGDEGPGKLGVPHLASVASVRDARPGSPSSSITSASAAVDHEDYAHRDIALPAHSIEKLRESHVVPVAPAVMLADKVALSDFMEVLDAAASKGAEMHYSSDSDEEDAGGDTEAAGAGAAEKK